METTNWLAIRALRPALYKGRIVGQKRSLKPKHVWEIRVRVELSKNHRNLALFNLAIDNKRRGYDLVKMKVINIMASGQIKLKSLHHRHITWRLTGSIIGYDRINFELQAAFPNRELPALYLLDFVAFRFQI